MPTASAALRRLVRAGQRAGAADRDLPDRRDSDRPRSTDHPSVPRGSQVAPAAAARRSIRPAMARIGLGDQRHAVLGDAGFLGGDLLAACRRGRLDDRWPSWAMPQTSGRFDDVGRVEPAAEPDLDDAGVGGGAGEGEEGGGGGRLEEADLHAVGGVERLGEQGGQRVVLDQLPGEADALVEADQMGAGVDMGAEPGRLDRGAQEGAGRALAVGAGDMEDRRQRALADCRARSSKAEIRSSPSMSRPARAGPAGRAGPGRAG